MFINKINSRLNYQTFKGYNHEINEIGRTVAKFYYPFDSKEQSAQIEFYRLRKNPKAYSGYEVENPSEVIARVELKPDGTPIDFEKIGLGPKESVAYRILVDGKPQRDTGVSVRAKVGDDDREFNIINRKGTTPLVQGKGYMTIPDADFAGIRYAGYHEDKTGSVIEDKNARKYAEGLIRSFSSKFGGNLAGFEHIMPELHKRGYTNLISTPFAGGDRVSYHKYWNENNMQLSPDMGNLENFANVMRSAFRHGIKLTFDGTYTSEGLQGIHFQYAVRWANQNPIELDYFRMDGVKDKPLGYGIIPKNYENLRHRVVNPKTVLNEDGTGVVPNLKYDDKKETYVQIYDATHVTPEQEADLDNLIEVYKNIKSEDLLSKVNHDDTFPAYTFEANPNELSKRLEAFVNYNKDSNSQMELNSPEGTLFYMQLSNFKFIRKTEGGFVTWDANTDMVKFRYFLSGYDEKELQKITDPAQRDEARQRKVMASFMARDMVLQAARHWSGLTNDVHVAYIAKTLGNIDTPEQIQELISNIELPKRAALNSNEIKNIKNGFYEFKPKKNLPKDEETISALMKLPLDALEFDSKTVGVLSSPYISNRAIDNDTLGKTRFDLMQEYNPHLKDEYAETYLKVNELYNNELKAFTDSVIEGLNEISQEKLLDSDGNYTEYGSYIINLFGREIARYAFLKSLAGENFHSKIIKGGDITYDYAEIKDKTSIKSLGIKAYSPKDEAKQLIGVMKKGLAALDEKDVAIVVNSLRIKTENTTTLSFRLAEAIANKAGYGLDNRLDAAKDTADMDSVRSATQDFNDAFDDVSEFWARYVDVVAEENPHSNIISETTDIDDLTKDTLGDYVNLYNSESNDIVRDKVGKKYAGAADTSLKYLYQTGITTEAAYSQFFTDVIKIFSRPFDGGNESGSARGLINDVVKDKLIYQKDVDYIRNLFTFIGNHDKPRAMHGMALDMNTFFANIDSYTLEGYYGYKADDATPVDGGFKFAREIRQDFAKMFYGVDNLEDLPLEVRLNIDNPDYFMTVSTRAISMSKLLLDAVNKGLADSSVTSEQKALLKKAIGNLTEGHYLGYGEKVDRASLRNVRELSSAKDAIIKVIEFAQNHGLSISENTRNDLINQVVARANDNRLIYKNLVAGDFVMDTMNSHIAGHNKYKLDCILGDKKPQSDEEYLEYSIYTLALVSLLKASFEELNWQDENIKKALNAGFADFVKTYNRNFVESHREDLPYIETDKNAKRKDMYAAVDIETAINMVLDEAEYIETATQDSIKSKRNEILPKVFKSALEPAMEKMSLMMSTLSAMPGNVTGYYGDDIGMTGWDNKAKNDYNQNRNTPKRSQLEDGPLKDIRKEMKAKFEEAMSLRNVEGAEALNNGTPYQLYTSDNDNFPAYMMFNGSEIAIPVLNLGGVSRGNRDIPYTKEGQIMDLTLPAGLALPAATALVIATAKEVIKLSVSKWNDGLYHIFRRGEHGNLPIPINKDTCRKGVMLITGKVKH